MSPSSVLIIEDDADVAENLAEFLATEGYEAQTAINGKVALEQLAAADRLPDAIILDLMMPVMNGIEFREAQLEDPRIAAIPVVLISADYQLEAKKSKIGAVESLRKPIDIDKLADVLRKLVVTKP